jgi:sucrose-6F-phosphate phosphohydrolase
MTDFDRFFASDIDNTLCQQPITGNETGPVVDLSVLGLPKSALLAYVSGRSPESVLTLIERRILPAPHFVVGDVGTRIFDCSRNEEDIGFSRTVLRGFDRARVIEACQGLMDRGIIRLQPHENQSPAKISFYVSSEDFSLPDIKSAANGCEIVYSSGRDLDILPRGCGKGMAVRHLARRFGIPDRRVLVCGDSGNDASLFQQGFCGVVVGNARPELKNTAFPGVYYAQAPAIKGVAEGIGHFRFAGE